ncbi:MAG: PQQ-binding-like beta-propeller repeat protein, partial [Candidatus Binatia bacterium]
MIRNAAALVVVAIVIVSSPVPAADSFSRRMANPQNTNDVGDQVALMPGNARNLKVVTTIPTNVKLLPNNEPNKNNKPNHTPVVSDGLLFFGDWNGFFYVIDLDDPSYRRLVVIDTGTGGNPGGTLGTYTGVQATPSIGTVTLPGGAGGQKRIYFGANSAAKTLWCLDVDRIIADRTNGVFQDTVEIGMADIAASPYNCQGASWPMSLTA